MTSDRLRSAFENEIRAGAVLAAQDRLDDAFRNFERAHVLGQRRTMLHLRAHWAMFRVGCRRRDLREIAAQLSRLVAALLFSRIWVPAGNTGGANVSAFAHMPIPDDLAGLMEDPA
jgi:hypothetical protein